MRNNCNIVRDMLPLYIEGIASADTGSLVEEHLESCAACRAEFEKMKAPSNLEKAASNMQSNSAMPLKTFKRKWHRKRTILVCSTIIATLAVICCVFFAVDHFVYQEEVMVNGAVYTQTDDKITELPTGCVEIGYLRGISHNSISHPIGNFMATNLDEKYGGCRIYQSEDDNQIIYLEDYSGFYIPFELTKQITELEKATE